MARLVLRALPARAPHRSGRFRSGDLSRHFGGKVVYLFLYALAQNKPLPIGTQNADLLDTRTQDEDDETGDLFETGEDDTPEETHSVGLRDEAASASATEEFGG